MHLKFNVNQKWVRVLLNTGMFIVQYQYLRICVYIFKLCVDDANHRMGKYCRHLRNIVYIARLAANCGAYSCSKHRAAPHAHWIKETLINLLLLPYSNIHFMTFEYILRFPSAFHYGIFPGSIGWQPTECHVMCVLFTKFSAKEEEPNKSAKLKAI